MRLHILIVIFTLISPIAQSQEEKCLSVIKNSRTLTSTLVDQEELRTEANSFCREFQQSSNSSGSSSLGFAYEALRLSFGNSSSRAGIMNEKICRNDGSGLARKDVYDYYLSTVHEKAYPAYEACLIYARRAKVITELDDMSDSSLILTLSHVMTSSVDRPILNVATNPPESAKCSIVQLLNSKPTKPSKAKGSFTFHMNVGSAALTCRKSAVQQSSVILVKDLNDASTQTMKILWPGTVEIEQTSVDALANSFTGAVVPFHAETCPDGWTEYDLAYGRFVRGIDRSGERIDPEESRVVGSLQEDTLQQHQHYYATSYYGNASMHATNRKWLSGGDQNLQNRTNEDGIQGVSPEHGARVSSESRPKNVALLYCRRNQQKR